MNCTMVKKENEVKSSNFIHFILFYIQMHHTFALESPNSVFECASHLTINLHKRLHLARCNGLTYPFDRSARCKVLRHSNNTRPI